MATMLGKFSYFQKCNFVVFGSCMQKYKISRITHVVRYHSFLVKPPSLGCYRTTYLTRRCSPGLLISRDLSTGDDKISADFIPAPPVAPDTLDSLASTLSQVEPSLASQGLANWTPTGLVGHVLDFIHVSVGLPWWATIGVATILVRIILLPVFVRVQRNTANLHNVMPQMQCIQMKITEARQNGNAMDAAKYGNDLIQFMKEKNCNPFKTMIGPLAQAPFFISFFLALRKMANFPVESFKEGGALWFTDLTIPDPFYGLPLITCITLFVTIEIGAEGGIQMNQSQIARHIVRFIPVVMFPFIINFPGAVLCYWVSTNAMTLLLVGLLKIPGVKPFLKIPAKIRHSPDDLPKRKGFKESWKDTMANMRMAREMEGRQQTDQIRFRKAGMGPVPKTYKFDPTKQMDKKRQKN